MNGETIYRMDLLSSENGTKFRPLTIKLTKVSVGKNPCNSKHRGHRPNIHLAETPVVAIVVDHCPAATHSEGTFLSEADLKKLLCPVPAPTSEAKVGGSRRELENAEGFDPQKSKKLVCLQKRPTIDAITPDQAKRKIKITIPIPKQDPVSNSNQDSIWNPKQDPVCNSNQDPDCPDSKSKQDLDDNPIQDPNRNQIPKKDSDDNPNQELSSTPIMVQLDQKPTIVELGQNPTIVQLDQNPTIVQLDQNPIIVKRNQSSIIVLPDQNPVPIQPDNNSKPVRSFVRAGRRKSSKLKTRRRVALANQNAEEFVQKKIQRRAGLAKRRNIDVIVLDRAKRKITIPSKFEGFDLETIPVPETRMDIGSIEQDLNSVSSLQETKQSSHEKMDQSAVLETEEITEKFGRNRRSSDSEYIENALPKSKARCSWKSNVNVKSVPSVAINRIIHEKKCPLPFPCPGCPMSFSKATQLALHKRRKGHYSPAKLTLCPNCGSSYGSLTNMWRHMKHYCPATKKIIKSHIKNSNCRSELIQSVGDFKFFLCSKCDKFFQSAASLHVHKMVHHGEKPVNAAQCPNCGTSYGSLPNMWRHMKDFCLATKKIIKSHIKTPNCRSELMQTVGNFNFFLCGNSKCVKIFQTVAGLQAHKTVNHGEERPLPCPSCPRSFSEASLLKSHMKRNGHEPYKSDKTIQPNSCPNCGVYSSVGNLWRHMKHFCPATKKIIRSQIQKSNSRSELMQSVGNFNFFLCSNSKCDKFFKSDATLQLHKTVHHGVKRPFPCPSCRMSFSDDSLLRRHIKRRCHKSKKPIKANSCPNCGVYSSETNIWRHMKHYCPATKKIIESHIKNSKDNRSRYVLQRHKVREHREKSPSPYSCPSSPRTFSLKSGLEAHKRRGHTLKKSYKTSVKLTVCPNCGTSYPNSLSTWRHMKLCPATKKIVESHMKKSDGSESLQTIGFYRFWNCSKCKDIFRNKVTLKHHKKLVHGDALAFSCPYPGCPMSFSYGAALVKHRTKNGH